MLAASVLAACSSANQRVAHADFGTTQALATTGSLRLVTERTRPGYQPVVCSEPSPDYAVALNATRKIAVAVNKAAPPAEPAADAVVGAAAAAPPFSGAAALDGSAVETVSEGRGRAAAVLALRDGLYAACQSYANGVIGHDAYAVILSQYGHLLVALVGGGRAELGSDGKPAAVAAATIDARKSTLSTLLVACVSGHDRTRIGSHGPNPILTETFCRNVMAAALRQATGGDVGRARVEPAVVK
ncbi:hypothetical protein [Hansschlegelia sp.]|uniref:hypothetical protein n=1 Tax=Hansschlegelia sp. TaxID=2041892 RepID=UPI002C063B6E|nr:hypothetical protein [Hansschlegelia sp.]HVI30184.1 hypothetical protein [Hansschlegelia sp.]